MREGGREKEGEGEGVEMEGGSEGGREREEKGGRKEKEGGREKEGGWKREGERIKIHSLLSLRHFSPLKDSRKKLSLRDRTASYRQCAHFLRESTIPPPRTTEPQCHHSHPHLHQRKWAWPPEENSAMLLSTASSI